MDKLEQSMEIIAIQAITDAKCQTIFIIKLVVREYMYSDFNVAYNHMPVSVVH